MQTNRLHLNLRGVSALLATVALVAGFAGGASVALAVAATPLTCAAAPGARSYGWPLKPFRMAHPVRGFFGDPRIGPGRHGIVRSFHFGIDIAGADGTPVYATLTGRVRGGHSGHDVVSVAGLHGRVFAYWHVVPAVRAGDHVVAYRTLIGHIAPSWGHVHFAEFRLGVALNPLRPGALGPYSDTTSPVITGLGVPRFGLAVTPTAPVAGLLDLVIEAHDGPSAGLPSPWDDVTAAPELVRWRLDHDPWQTALDFRRTVPAPDHYDEIYAYHTHQNRPNHRGHYLIYLAKGWDASGLVAGPHTLEAIVSDIRGNVAVSSTTIMIGG